MKAPDIIEFYHKPEDPQNVSDCSGVVIDKDFREFLPDSDHKIISAEWTKALTTHPQLFSKTRGIVSLRSTSRVSEGSLDFIFADFATYLAINRTAEHPFPPMSPFAYDKMMAGSLGAAVYTSDGLVLTHKRPEGLSHVSNVRDASVGAFMRNPDALNSLNFGQQFGMVLARELNFTPKEIENLTAGKDGYSLKLTGVHSCSKPDFSGMVNAAIRVPFTYKELVERANSAALHDPLGVPVDELPEYIFNHFLRPESPEQRLISDGVATLAASLPHDDFLKLFSRINHERSGTFSLGELCDGVFHKLS